MLSFECIKNEKSVYFLLTSANLEDFTEKESVIGHQEIVVIYLPNFREQHITTGASRPA